MKRAAWLRACSIARSGHRRRLSWFDFLTAYARVQQRQPDLSDL